MPSVNTSFDFSALAPFWIILDQLSNDLEPSTKTWQSLLTLSGYRELIEHEFSEEFFIQHFSLAFRPSKRQQLSEALLGSRKNYLRHYLQVANERSKIEEQIRWLAETPLADAAAQLAREWLPTGIGDTPPTVHFVIFGPDARGFSSVVVDAAFTLNLPDVAAALAHEFHHVYRRRLVAERIVSPPANVADVVWALNQLHLEGLADQIDKRDWLDATPTSGPVAAYAKRYAEHFVNSPATIQALSDSLEECAESPGRLQDVGKRIRAALPLAGHPTGAFMVRTIEEAFGRSACIETVHDPFEFLRLYSAAARQAQKAPPLTATALRGVDSIARFISTATA